MKINPYLTNRAQCKICKDILVSTDPNRKITCSCGSLVINGGLEHLVRIWRQPLGSWEELSTPNYKYIYA